MTEVWTSLVNRHLKGGRTCLLILCVCCCLLRAVQSKDLRNLVGGALKGD